MLVFTVSHRPVLSVRVRSTFVLKAFDYFKWPLNILGNFAHLTLINCQTAHGKSFLAHTLNPRACLKLTCIFFLIVSKGNDKVCKRKNTIKFKLKWHNHDYLLLTYKCSVTDWLFQLSWRPRRGWSHLDCRFRSLEKKAYSLSPYSSPNQFLKHQDSLFWLACSRLRDGRVGKIEKALTRK